jgi:DNA-binding response OmpR family regulator
MRNGTRRRPARASSVLIVDDEPDIRRLLALWLQTADAESRAAVSGVAALRALELGYVPDLIICDLAMPGLSGAELYRRVCAQWPALAGRFLFVTGGALTGADRAFAEAHAHELVEKPFVLTELEARVRHKLTGEDAGAGLPPSRSEPLR